MKTVIRDTNHSTDYLGLVQGVLVILKCCYNIDFYKDVRLEAQVYKNHLSYKAVSFRSALAVI